MRTLAFAFALAFALVSLAPLASASIDPGVCTWNKGTCGPLDVVCVTDNGEHVACLTVLCTDQGGCQWPPRITICGDPCD